MGADGTVRYTIEGDATSLHNATTKGTRGIRDMEGAAKKARLSLDGMGAGLAGLAAGGVFADLIGRGLAFNKTMNDSEVAIANVLKQFKGLDDVAAKNEAAAAMKQLIDLEPKAAGTLQDLVSGFLATVASSQQAGISVADNIDLVGRFANALANANIPAHQLTQEMRSILTGNIGADSSLAKVLNITNDMVKEAAQAGNLYGFLVQKIGALGQAGDTAGVAFSSLQSAIDKALGKTTEALFQVILKDAKDLTAVVDANAESFAALGVVIGNTAKAAGQLFEWANMAGKGIGIAIDAIVNGRSLAESGKAFDQAQIDKAAAAHLEKFGVTPDKPAAAGGGIPAGAAQPAQPAAAAAAANAAAGKAAGGRQRNARGEAAGRHKIMGYQPEQWATNPGTDRRTFDQFFSPERSERLTKDWQDFFYLDGKHMKANRNSDAFNAAFGGKKTPDGMPGQEPAGRKEKPGAAKDAAMNKLESLMTQMVEEIRRVRTE